MFSLIQIIKFPTRMTCGNLSLTDHILARLPERISQEGEMNVGLSDHQFNYFIAIGKLVQLKLEVCTKKLNSVHFKNYADDAIKTL